MFKFYTLISNTFLQIYGIFIPIIKFYGLLHGQIVMLTQTYFSYNDYFSPPQVHFDPRKSDTLKFVDLYPFQWNTPW